MAEVNYIDSEALSQLLQGDGEKPLIIDVRDSDFEGGHIQGAINIPSEEFDDPDFVEQTIEKYKTKPKVVFHCMMSQVRGPKCARRFANRLDAVLTENESRPEVQILAGGFQTFVKTHRNWCTDVSAEYD